MASHNLSNTHEGTAGEPLVGRRAVLAGGLAMAVAGSSELAWAAPEFPARPLSILVPANPGGGWDQIARLMQHVVSERNLCPKPVEVINRGGAGGAIGLAELVSRRHGDPYTIMSAGAVMLGSTIAQNSPFRASDTEPLARLIIEHLVIAVPTESPFHKLEDFLQAFRRDPAAISWCGGSAGGVDHMLVGLISEAAGVPTSRTRYIAYSGGGEASAAIMGNQVDAAVAGYGEWKSLADAGRIRVLGSASPERFGDGTIPTLKEAGLDVVLQNWRGIFAPPGLEARHLDWWRALLDRMRRSEVWCEHLRANSWDDGFLEGEPYREFIRAEEERTARTLKRLGIGGTDGGYSPVGPWAFPAAIGIAGVAAVGAVVREQIRLPAGATIMPAGVEEDDEGDGALPDWRRFAAGAALVLAYILVLPFAGFLIATPVMVMAICLLMRSGTLRWDAVAAIGLTVGVWVLFSRFLFVYLP